MFFEAMIVNLLNRFYIGFCLIPIFDYMYVNRCVVI